MDFDWKALVKTVAPGIASVFGTPLAGMGVSALLNVLLPTGEAKPANPEEWLAKTLSAANPEMMLKMKQADQAFTLDMKKLDIDVLKLGVDERANARQREVELSKAGQKDGTPKVLAFSIVGGFLSMTCGLIVTALTGYSIDSNAMGLIGTLVGYLSAKSELVLAYYFGSSSGSQAKDRMLADSMPAPKP